MFFTTFNPMTPEKIEAGVAAAPKAETCLKPSTLLEGKQMRLKFKGKYAPDQLDYVFGSDFTLSLSENGRTYALVPYNALQLRDNIVLFTHTIPGTSRGWHIVADLKTSLVTAFETWFGITVPVGGSLQGDRKPTHTRDIPREVQRHYHFGYIDTGQASPEKLHTTTNRLEGRGMHWKFCCGSECLTYFPSVVCSTTVLLNEPLDDVTITYPSDYLRINDELYIYAKWGVEFGGEMWLEVLDLFNLKTIGVKFGFNACDEFEYGMHSAALTITGDAAHLEKITLNGDKEPPMARLIDKKGARYAYRPRDYDIPMTKAEAHEAAKNLVLFDLEGPNIMMSGNRLEFNYDLTGRQFKLKYDRVESPYAWSAKNIPEKLIQEYEYDIISEKTLKWREPGGQWHEEEYICFEPAKDIYFFSHMLSGDPDFASVAQAVDVSAGLSTCVYGRIGSWTSEWEVGATCLFGIAEGDGIAPAPFSRRHGFTTDLVGKTYSWNYSETSSSIHVYSSPNSYSWTIFQEDNSGGATWSSPSFYIKLRDDAYLFQWTEENCNGSQGLVCINPRILHDGGFFYGVNHERLSLNITGAYARNLGTFDVMKYFDKRAVL